MNWKNSFINIMIIILDCCTLKVSNIQFQCRKYNFMSNFNLNTEDRIVVLYNAAFCSQYLKMLPLLENLHLRFTEANFTNLQFVVLTAAPSDSTTLAELFQTSGNVTIIALQNIQNNIFLPGWVYIFDACSRLIYELAPQLNGMDIYIKASVLSAWYDSICGNCKGYHEENYDFDENEYTSFNPTNNDSFENDENEEDTFEATNFSEESTHISRGSNSYIPLKIILPIQHIDKCDNCSFYQLRDYIVLSSNDSVFHQHLPSADVLYLWQKAYNNKNITSQNNLDSSFNTSYFTSSEGRVYLKKGSSGVLANNHVYEIKPFRYTENLNLSQHKIVKKSSKLEISSSFHFWLSTHLNKSNVN